jgi:YgiT-type zinc finger domain-containing protein
MNEQHRTETMESRLVTYTIEVDGRIIVIEHVPARVCVETGEQFFAPETVERIHAIVQGDRKPVRTVQTPVYEFAA